MNFCIGSPPFKLQSKPSLGRQQRAVSWWRLFQPYAAEWGQLSQLSSSRVFQSRASPLLLRAGRVSCNAWGTHTDQILD